MCAVHNAALDSAEEDEEELDAAAPEGSEAEAAVAAPSMISTRDRFGGKPDAGTADSSPQNGQLFVNHNK